MTQQPKLSDMTGYEPEAVMVVQRKEYEALKTLNAELLAALKQIYYSFDANARATAKVAIDKGEGR